MYLGSPFFPEAKGRVVLLRFMAHIRGWGRGEPIRLRSGGEIKRESESLWRYGESGIINAQNQRETHQQNIVTEYDKPSHKPSNPTPWTHATQDDRRRKEKVREKFL